MAAGSGAHEHDQDAADQRMAELLASKQSTADIRRELQQAPSPHADDLLARVNALDFVQSVVGETVAHPTRLGDYEIRGVLGRGGMGVVYLAWQADLEREVALKVLSQAYSADPAMRQRFRAEARATAALHHAHIVPIYGYGEAHGQLYFAMERVDGLSLDRHIDAARRAGRPPLAPLDAARRFAGVADALGLAHRRRLLHRDVKPGNILVAADGTLALTDFGLAKALDRATLSVTRASGGFLGTLHYASPEQALGRELTPASDLYSLGVTLFEAVSGHLPQAGTTTEALLQSLLQGTPRRLREVLPQPPRDLEAVLEKLLAREPQDRYQDGEALARDLLRIADGEPVHIRRQPIFLRLYRRVRKNPVLSAVFAVALLLLVSTAGLIQAVRKEKVANLAARHQGTLAEIVRAIENEGGDVFGPPPLLAALTGVAQPPQRPPSAAVLGWFERAQREQPEDAVVAAMRTAWLEDPLPEASALLAQGRGLQALRLLQDAIAATPRLDADHAASFRLYRLYLASAVANLTESVGRLGDARTDLAKAEFLRPGALFPQVLRDFLQVCDADDVESTLIALEREHAQAAVERRAVLGQLLLALAGWSPMPGANLLSRPLAAADRSAMHEAGQRLSRGANAPRAAAATDSLESRLRDLAVQAAQASGASARFRDAAAALSAETRLAVHPQSLLQCWSGAVQLIEQPRPGVPLLDPDGRPLSATQQLAAWKSLLALGPGPRLLQERLERFESVRPRLAALPEFPAIAAGVHTEARSPRAFEFARAWVQEQPQDPEALFCRMKAWLAADGQRTERTGSLARAADDAMACIQRAPDRRGMVARVIQAWEQAVVDAQADELRAAMLAMIANLRAFA